MMEPWVYLASLHAVDPERNGPDRPISGRLAKTSRKPARAGLAMILYPWTYQQNGAATSTIRTIRNANSTSAPSSQVVSSRPARRMPFTLVTLTNRIGKKRKARGPQNRKLIQRGHLQDQLLTWLASAYASDPLRAVRPASFILDAKAIKALHPDRLTSVSQVVSAVQETEEWGIE
ncbi:hypothetical protein B0H11DRAFT_1942093 [Mycena galericulata]|nr:hypothetical protein B0H11DRAFT_1942093 [Mycena galericulata]